MAAALPWRGRSVRHIGGRPTLGTAALSLSDAVAARVEAEACRPPSDVGLPVTHGSASLLGKHVRSQDIEVSDRSVSRILHDADLQPHRHLGRQALARGSFTSTDDLAAKIDAYVAWYLETDQPLRWSYRPKSWSSASRRRSR